MATYQLYFFNSHHYLGSEQVEADSDYGALQVARTLNGNVSIELWCGHRKVRMIPACERKLLSPPAPPLVPRPA